MNMALEGRDLRRNLALEGQGTSPLKGTLYPGSS